MNSKKRAISAIAITICLMVALAGCRGVTLSAEYSTLLDDTASLSARTAEMAVDGELSEENKTQALVKQSEVWKLFQDARDGRESGE